MKQTWMVALGTAFFAPSLAIAAPGDLLVTEYYGNSVAEVSAPGDYTDAPRFATGLDGPIGICVGPENHLYVAESNTGFIKIIPDDGGDMAEVEPYATAATGIGGLWCDNDRIVISCPLCFPGVGMAAVVEIQEGGLVTETATFLAYNFPLSGDTFTDAAGDLHILAGDIYNVSSGGDQTGIDAVSSGLALLAGYDMNGTILGGESQANRIFDVTALGDLSMEEPWATLPDLGEDGAIQAIMQTQAGVLYVSHGNEIYEVPAIGGDLSGASPHATGLDTSLLVQGMVEHVCGSNDDCADEDLCNGEELCVNNECVAPKGELDCDDDDVCTADSCDAAGGCANDPIAGCCEVDLDCAVDELCDAGSNQCVPTGVPGDDGDTEPGGASDGPGDDGPSDGTTGGGPGAGDDAPGDSSGGVGDSSGGDAGAAGDDPAGCSCRGGSPTAPSVLWLVPLLFARRRRA
ncbi:MAG: hypothetical protein AAF721_38850 [Myxococcota bacterium]